MSPADPRLEIAQHIHLGLRRELGQGIEVPRLLAEPLYARDVLLVCAALPRTELAALAQQFSLLTPDTASDSARHAAHQFAHDSAPDSAPADPWAEDSSDFGADAARRFPAPRRLARAPRHWLSPARWLGLR